MKNLEYSRNTLEKILPHGKELVLIEEVLTIGESSARCLVRIPLLESFLPDVEGNVSSLVAIEIIAQVASVGKSLDWKENEPTKAQPKSGMVVRLREFSFKTPVIDSSKALISEASWTNSSFSVFDVNGKIFYENSPGVILAEGSLLLVT